MLHSFVKYPLVLLLFLFLFFSACDPGLIFQENQHVNNNSWPVDTSYTFQFLIEDTVSFNNFYVNIRNTTNYEYSNLFVFLNTRFPNGNVYRDTIECLLADKEGRWLGKGMGKIKDNSILVRRNVRFPVSGVYQMNVEQGMREEVLSGISDIGIRIEKIEK